MPTDATHRQRRGLATFAFVALTVPLAVGGGVAWWYVRCELPYVNHAEFISPLAVETLTIRNDAKGSGHFGAPRSGRRYHTGVDVLGHVGDPVYAIRSGYVREARYHKGFGFFVQVDHGGGFSSLYAHLSRLDVRPGERVRQGQLLGAVGKSGNARSKLVAAHLHFELRKDGIPIDPDMITFFHAHLTDPANEPPAS